MARRARGSWRRRQRAEAALEAALGAWLVSEDESSFSPAGVELRRARDEATSAGVPRSRFVEMLEAEREKIAALKAELS